MITMEYLLDALSTYGVTQVGIVEQYFHRGQIKGAIMYFTLVKGSHCPSLQDTLATYKLLPKYGIVTELKQDTNSVTVQVKQLIDPIIPADIFNYMSQYKGAN